MQAEAATVHCGLMATTFLKSQKCYLRPRLAQFIVAKGHTILNINNQENLLTIMFMNETLAAQLSPFIYTFILILWACILYGQHIMISIFNLHTNIHSAINFKKYRAWPTPYSTVRHSAHPFMAYSQAIHIRVNVKPLLGRLHKTPMLYCRQGIGDQNWLEALYYAISKDSILRVWLRAFPKMCEFTSLLAIDILLFIGTRCPFKGIIIHLSHINFS